MENTNKWATNKKNHLIDIIPTKTWIKCHLSIQKVELDQKAETMKQKPDISAEPLCPWARPLTHTADTGQREMT